MKTDIHPDYKKIKIIKTDGSEYFTYSTYSKSDTLRLEIDDLSHAAYTGKQNVSRTEKQVSKFTNKYKNLNFGGK